MNTIASEKYERMSDVAQGLAVNPMTVSKAYGLLEAEGILERRRGLPMVVAFHHPKAQEPADRALLLRPTLERAAQEAHQLKLSNAQALSLFKTILRETKDSET